MTVRDDGGNVAIDYVWGNLPMQPNDDRGENTLDPALDNHSTAINGYQGFPGYLPNTGDATGGFTVDATLTGVAMDKDSLIGWSLSKADNGIALGDWVRISGATVIDPSGAPNPSGSIDINGDYLIDAKNGNAVSSAALRAEIGDLAFYNASSFGTFTVEVDHA